MRVFFSKGDNFETSKCCMASQKMGIIIDSDSLKIKIFWYKPGMRRVEKKVGSGFGSGFRKFLGSGFGLTKSILNNHF